MGHASADFRPGTHVCVCACVCVCVCVWVEGRCVCVCVCSAPTHACLTSRLAGWGGELHHGELLFVHYEGNDQLPDAKGDGPYKGPLYWKLPQLTIPHKLKDEHWVADVRVYDVDNHNKYV